MLRSWGNVGGSRLFRPWLTPCLGCWIRGNVGCPSRLASPSHGTGNWRGNPESVRAVRPGPSASGSVNAVDSGAPVPWSARVLGRRTSFSSTSSSSPELMGVASPATSPETEILSVVSVGTAAGSATPSWVYPRNLLGGWELRVAVPIERRCESEKTRVLRFFPELFLHLSYHSFSPGSTGDLTVDFP
jgi:hypothetical protein